MIELILYILLSFLVVAAFAVIFSDDLLSCLIILSIFSAVLVIVFVIFQAPDVALAEAVIAAGITTGFFVITINKTEGVE
ncbi:Na(+)/H(+) antiporter subunit B [Halonatronum saccharophilum]|uniref:Na(+)/H(+) antiporter subunit B n=1 Tax=Halonatronum saccharophilum TaxID=150060 RepID=UPI0004883D99|nr:hydrogenase subunit MbhD domain-containing protein [Halonatronum saccharophilum]